MPTTFVKKLGRTLDARPDRLDLRDREYVPPVVTLPPSCPDDGQIKAWLPAYVKAALILDQGEEGACTGFGLACVVNYLHWRQRIASGDRRRLERVSPRMLYHLARFYDEWPGEDYEGSSCRGALKAWHKHGVCKESLWPYRDKRGRNVFISPSEGWDADAVQRRLGVYYRINHASVVDMQAAIREIGAVYVSADVHDGWDLAARKTITGHGSLPVIRPLRKPDSLGGHAFAMVGYNPVGFVVQNSWGVEWGNQGFATLPYEEWVRYGSDAWACALGVPADASRSSAVIVRSQSVPSLTQVRGVAVRPSGAASAASVSTPVEPWSSDKAYRHTVVMGNEGRPINRIVTHQDGQTSVSEIVAREPRAWFGDGAGAKRLMLYAHGGLNSEEESLQRIQVLAPYFEANGIYPLFVTWKTGPLETISNVIEDELARIPRPEGGVRDVWGRVTETVSEAFDRTVEVMAGPVMKPIWSQMKQNAEASVAAARGCQLIARGLADLAGAVGNLEIHLVGHSAGSILLGHLLDVLRDQKLRVRTCSLYAPACTVRFALDHYAPCVADGMLAKNDFHVHLLSDRRERDDRVGPYGKSLLYLVSRALEAAHKTPLLGLAEVFNTAKRALGQWNSAEQDAVRQWQGVWGAPGRTLHVLDAAQVSTGPKGRHIKAAHGCFDNDADTITATLKRILRAAPQHRVESLDY